jgi:hypothetical protein
MIIIGVDFHPEFQQIASVDTDTGEFKERRLAHREEGEKFCRGLAAGVRRCVLGWWPAGHARWFERLMAALQALSCLPWLSARIRSSLSLDYGRADEPHPGDCLSRTLRSTGVSALPS